MRKPVQAVIFGVLVALVIAAAAVISNELLESSQRYGSKSYTPLSPGREMPIGDETPIVSAPHGSITFSLLPDLAADAQQACRERLLRKGVYVPAGDTCIDLDDLIKNLTTGTYRFNKPDTVYLDEPFRIVLVLQTAEGQDTSSVLAGTAGKVQERQGPVAQHLEATLQGGADFRVTPSDPQHRTVTSRVPVSWEWTVVPLRHGKKTLVIEVAATLLVGANKQRVQVGMLREDIEISVGVFRWVLSAFSGPLGIALGLAALIIAVLAAFIYLRTERPAGVAYGLAGLSAAVEMPPSARSQLREAILAGFDPAALDEVLRDNEMSRPNIAIGPDFATRINSLIDVAHREGWLIELCDRLAAARQRNEVVSSAILAVRQSLIDRTTQVKSDA